MILVTRTEHCEYICTVHISGVDRRRPFSLAIGCLDVINLSSSGTAAPARLHVRFRDHQSNRRALHIYSTWYSKRFSGGTLAGRFAYTVQFSWRSGRIM